MRQTRKIVIAAISMGLFVVLAAGWIFYHESVSAGDEKPYSVSLNSPITFPVEI